MHFVSLIYATKYAIEKFKCFEIKKTMASLLQRIHSDQLCRAQSHATVIAGSNCVAIALAMLPT